MNTDRLRAALEKLRRAEGDWRYLGEPYRRLFAQLEPLGYAEGRLNPETDLHEHRITRQGMDKLWELRPVEVVDPPPPLEWREVRRRGLEAMIWGLERNDRHKEAAALREELERDE